MPRIKIISTGVDTGTQVMYRDKSDGEWIDLSGVVSEVCWHLRVGEAAHAEIVVALPELMAAADAVRVSIERLQAETEEPCATE